MSKGAVWLGVALVFVGAIIVLLGGVMRFGAYTTITHAIDVDNVNLLASAYQEIQVADIVATFGTFMAFIGIAIGLGGMALDPSPQLATIEAQSQQPTQLTQYPLKR